MEFFCNAQRIRHQIQKGTVCTFIAKNGKEILLRIVRVAVIDTTVHMYSQIDDHDKITVQIDQTGNKTVSLANHDFSGDGKRPVKPGSADHTAVPLHIQLGIVACCFHFRIFPSA